MVSEEDPDVASLPASPLDLRAAAYGAFALLLGAAASYAGAPNACGDGVTDSPPEDCDDSNTANGDGCDENCRFEVCGNGVVQPGTTPPEECDDGNTVDDDNCTAPDCQFDCGDGEIDATTTPPEICEDGNGTNNDGCDDDTTTNPPGNCTHTDCGNGVVTGTEQCDDGNLVSGDGCEPDCTTETPIGPDPDQQRCINAVNKNLAGVLKARGGDNAACVKSVASGEVDLRRLLRARPRREGGQGAGEDHQHVRQEVQRPRQRRRTSPSRTPRR